MMKNIVIIFILFTALIFPKQDRECNTFLYDHNAAEIEKLMSSIKDAALSEGKIEVLHQYFKGDTSRQIIDKMDMISNCFKTSGDSLNQYLAKVYLSRFHYRRGDFELTKKEVWEKAIDTNMKIVDATCPLVYEIHEEVIKLESDGRKIIIIGDHDHDEVVGIASQVENPIIISTPDEAKEMKKVKYAGVVSQSTQSLENVQEIINILMTKIYDLHFINTICFPTKRNQEQIKKLANECDVMIVIGSFTSANSKRLTLLAKERNKKSYQVTCGGDVNSKWFSDTDIVGISAGASTPDYLIQEVKEKIENIKDSV